MKILILYTYNKGYLSSFFFELSLKLSQRGHDVVNCSFKSEMKTYIQDGIKMVFYKKGGYVSNYFNTYKIIKKETPDVVLSNFSYVNPALLFGKLFRVKKNMVWFHSLNKQMQSTTKDIYIKKLFLKLADLVIANSVLTERELHHIYKVPQHKMLSMPFWSDISNRNVEVYNFRIEDQPDTIKIGCPGRLVEHKNQKVVIEALSKLKHTSDFKFQLYLAGEGEAFSNLLQLTETLEIKENVSFLQHVSANDMVAFYKSMDVIVLPSLHEAFGLVFIEAMSLGTPVIVSSQFGALSFIQDQNDILSSFTFNPESSDELKEKLIPYFKGEGLSNDFFKQLYLNNFDKEIISERIAKSIEHKNDTFK